MGLGGTIPKIRRKRRFEEVLKNSYEPSLECPGVPVSRESWYSTDPKGQRTHTTTDGTRGDRSPGHSGSFTERFRGPGSERLRTVSTRCRELTPVR